MCLDVSVGGPLTASVGVSDVGLLSIITRCHRLTSLTISRLSALTDAVLLALAAEGQLRSLTARRCEQFTDTGVVSVLSACGRLEWLDVTGCIHVSKTSLMTAVDVIESVEDSDHPRRALNLTLCVGGTSVMDVTDLLLPSRLHVDTTTPYDMWQTDVVDWDSDQSADDDDAADVADDAEMFLDNDDELNSERWNLS